MTAKKEPLKLMPLDEFKSFVRAIVRVPKDTGEKDKPARPKAKRAGDSNRS